MYLVLTQNIYSMQKNNSVKHEMRKTINGFVFIDDDNIQGNHIVQFVMCHRRYGLYNITCSSIDDALLRYRNWLRSKIQNQRCMECPEAENADGFPFYAHQLA
jgi:hypothetical protein